MAALSTCPPPGQGFLQSTVPPAEAVAVERAVLSRRAEFAAARACARASLAVLGRLRNRPCLLIAGPSQREVTPYSMDVPEAVQRVGDLL